LVHQLRPAALDQLGLAGALAAHVSQLEQHGGPTIDVEVIPDPLPDLPAAVEVAAYRIAREAVTNVVRHAAATRCEATLEVEGARMWLLVDDDGVGLDQPVTPGVGLRSMQARAEELGGSLAVTSTDCGTQVRVTLPIAGWVRHQEDRQRQAAPAATRGGGA
jgi:signal transduction histidine kinase